MRLLTLLALACPAIAFGQLSLTNVDTPYVIDFESSMPGVNAGAYLANSQISPSPSAGSLDSDAWAFSDVYDGETTSFGGSTPTMSKLQYQRGSSTPSAALAGLSNFTTSGSNHTLGIKNNADVLNQGWITLRVQNNTGKTVTSFEFSYRPYSYNLNDQAWGLSVVTSTDNISFSSSIAALRYTTSSDANWSGGALLSATIGGLSVEDGEYFYFRFVGDTVAAATSVIALDDISITAVPEPSEYACLLGSLSALFALRRRLRQRPSTTIG